MSPGKSGQLFSIYLGHIKGKRQKGSGLYSKIWTYFYSVSNERLIISANLSNGRAWRHINCDSATQQTAVKSDSLHQTFGTIAFLFYFALARCRFLRSVCAEVPAYIRRRELMIFTLCRAVIARGGEVELIAGKMMEGAKQTGFVPASQPLAGS